MARWAIIYNPVSGSYRARTLAAIESFLQSQGIVTIALPTRNPGHATEIARTIEEVSCVAVFGGDGTLNEVANGLAGRGLPLAFLPGGTASVMARELGISRDPLRAARALLRGRPVEIRPGQIGSRLFLLMAGRQKSGDHAIAVGDRIPEFSAPDENGEIFESSSLAGGAVVLKVFRGHW